MSGFAFGRAINVETQAALERKQNILSSPSVLKEKFGEENALPPGIAREFFNVRTSWVKLTSGVQINNPGLLEYFEQDGAGSLAYYNALSGLQSFGGVGISENERLQQYTGGDFGSRGSLPGTVSYAEYGFRPRPGITGVTVTSHGMYGALRTVNVSFKCFTPYQLDILDVLYMRPGYTLLLEFGHSHYLDDGEGNGKDPSKYTIQESMFGIDLWGGNSSLRNGIMDDDGFNFISQLVAERKQQQKGAYEGFVGVIKNYNWTFLPDGSYDCSVDLVSKGEIMESLAINIGTSYSNSSEKYSEIKNNIKAYARIGSTSGWHETQPYYVDRTIGNFGEGVYAQEIATADSTTKLHTYVTFQLLNAIMNEYMISTSTDTNGRTPALYVQLDTEFEANFYHTSNIHISINPSVCLLPKEAPETRTFFPGYNFTNRTNQPLEKDTIKDILINTDFIIKTIDSCINSRGQLEVMKFYNSIFRGIEQATGNINQFELHCDENNTYYILDRKLLKNRGDQPDPIKLYGLGAVVKNLNLSSKLSPKISSMIAIAAQANSSKLGADATAFRKLNEGLTDGIMPRKLATGLGEGQTEVYRITEELAADGSSILKIEETTAYTDLLARIEQTYSQTALSSTIEGNIEGPYSSFLLTALESKAEPHSSFAIPFELTLTLDGTGGFTVGETFEISSDILPLSYKRLVEKEVEDELTGGTMTEYSVSKDNKVGFIITGLEQRVSTVGWDTIIKSQIYLKTNKNTRTADFLPDASTLTVTSEWLDYVNRTAWSASFIVYCANKAGGNIGKPNSFPKPGAHAEYTSAIRKDMLEEFENNTTRRYPNWTVWYLETRGGKKDVEVGDILVNNRKSYSSQPSGMNIYEQYNFLTLNSQPGHPKYSQPYSGATHGAIVVAINDGVATLVSGNMSDTVKKHTLQLENGGIPNSRSASYLAVGDQRLYEQERYFGIIKPSSQQLANEIVAVALQEFNRVGERKDNTPEMAPIITEYYSAAILRHRPPAWQP